MERGSRRAPRGGDASRRSPHRRAWRACGCMPRPRISYKYVGKGHHLGRRELPRPAYEAICITLADAGRDLATMEPAESLWQAGSRASGVTSSTFYARLQRYMRAAGVPLSGVHVLRHTAAKLRRDAGESIEAVRQFLDHSSLHVTSVYLKRLEGTEDRTWPSVAESIGV